MKKIFLFVFTLIPGLLFAKNGEHSIATGLIVGAIFAIGFWLFDSSKKKIKDSKIPKNATHIYKHFSHIDLNNKETVFNEKQEICISESNVILSGYFTKAYPIIKSQNIGNNNILYTCHDGKKDISIILDLNQNNVYLCESPLTENSLDKNLYVFTNLPL